MNPFYRGCLVIYVTLSITDTVWLVTLMVDPTWLPEARRLWKFYVWPPMTLLVGICSAFEFGLGHSLLGSMWAWFTMMHIYQWWHDEDNQRRRRKLRERLAERVKDIGGRLIVVRPSGA